ncbi:hypothetical protein WR25_07084 isoform C [Diploscapter pachys]|uniref:Uncharacterized protein n=1 Tax=Diploscapter pachys TaxID=2018661 RepID=A0A2A2LMB8_9BILA|nr:hypothetical protein WR25_07084 isoform C [Diploscapter pachys]
MQGLYDITHDDVTEYGHTINTLKRFNLYPEVIFAFFYRIFKGITDAVNINTQTCWKINRGSNLPPIESCEGIGNPHYFYVDNVFASAGTVAGSIFVMGVLMSDSIFGGFLALAAFAFNHGEATRVQWTPPLRESWAFPFIIAQIAFVTYIIRNKKSGLSWAIGMAVLSIFAKLYWQFSQFAFFTQLGSIFVLHAFDFSSLSTIKTLLLGHFISFCTSFVLLFGNEMLFTSFYFPSICSFALALLIYPLLNKITFRPVFVLINLTLFVAGSFGLKFVISNTLQVHDDAHILDILRAKFLGVHNFHTRLYTCSAEFNFIPKETLWKLTQSLLLPSAGAAVLIFAIYFIFYSEKSSVLWRSTENKGRHFADIFYNVVQLICYCSITYLIMRLKLFGTPHLCIATAILANNKLLNIILKDRLNKWAHIGLIGLLIAAMAHHGRENIKKQYNIIGEYSNPDQEALFDWINKSTKPGAVFAGTMPVMANVKLSTGRPIVNHPHYEDVGIRERTLKVYSIFSRKPIAEVYETLKNMGVNYVLFQTMNCAMNGNK